MAQYNGGQGWLFTPDLGKDLTVENEQSFFESPDAFRAILENIQDGVSILDRSLSIRYLNATLRYIYADEKDAVGKKCYQVYHGRKTPCDHCPTLEAIQTKQPCTNTVRYDRGGGQSNWHQIFAMPVTNTSGEVILVIEYIRDITFQNSMAENLGELAQRFETLEQQNEILAGILNQREHYREELEQTITTNVERFVKPSLEYLKKTIRTEDVELVSGLIDEIVYPITKRRDSATALLTPRELQIALMIREGATSKEIAAKLCVTQKAVDFHRLNIRKKLKLPREANLRTFLEIHL